MPLAPPLSRGMWAAQGRLMEEYGMEEYGMEEHQGGARVWVAHPVHH